MLKPLVYKRQGNAPGIRATRIRLAEGQIHVKTVIVVSMAFGQKRLVFHVPGALPCRLYTSRFIWRRFSTTLAQDLRIDFGRI